MKSAAGRPSRILPVAIVHAVLLFLAASMLMIRGAGAEPHLDYAVKLAIKEHYENRLALNNCTSLFRYYSVDASNWTSQGDSVRVQVVLYAEYIGKTSLYGNSEMSRICLGRQAGPEFFEPGKTYPTVGLVYTLSKWSQGWHVDKLEYQP